MNITIKQDNSLKDDEIVIMCNEKNNNSIRIMEILNEYNKNRQKIMLMKKGSECYISLDKILFFESSDGNVYAHLKNDTYDTKKKLYELEKELNENFIRISKSTIINVTQISSITRNVTSSSLVEFYNSYKTVYVSRLYYKKLKEALK